MSSRRLQSAAIASLLGLIALWLAWELWLAPLRPGGSWLVRKVLPLLAPLRGLLHGRRRTYQWTPFFALAYLGEGAVRAWTEPGSARVLAGVEIGLASALFVAWVLVPCALGQRTA